jgi:hypothetical protein
MGQVNPVLLCQTQHFSSDQYVYTTAELSRVWLRDSGRGWDRHRQTQRCQAFYPSDILSSNQESVFLGKTSLKFLQSNPGNCYNPHIRGVIRGIGETNVSLTVWPPKWVISKFTKSKWGWGLTYVFLAFALIFVAVLVAAWLVIRGSWCVNILALRSNLVFYDKAVEIMLFFFFLCGTGV